ncbi:MAG: moeB [Segetibacter sp.]|nr:moeB [Segetibacter sp.]
MPEISQRYNRQILLPEFGEAGQQKLLQAKVLVIGAGGLGCPVLQYLAAAGVGTIGIVDDDVVSLSNLHRQVLYSTNDVGLPKVERATAVLKNLNPGIEIVPYNLRLTNQNALDIIGDFDIVVDGTDNFSTRYMVNDACVLLNKPLVYGAISKFEGQVAVFNCTQNTIEKPVNYRDLFPNPPAEDEVMNCAEAGVLGVLPGIIGSMQANETIKLITGIGQPLIDRLFSYNALNNLTYDFLLTTSEEATSHIPKDTVAFMNTDYDLACSTNSSIEIDAAEFNALLSNKYITVIDVREEGEKPVITEFPHLHIPFAQLKESAHALNTEVIITFCQSGGRSLKAAKLLFDTVGPAKKIYSLRGGIINWKNIQANK